MNEAMTRIRYELGMDAVIISQRKIRKPGIKGLFAPKVIEVTATVDDRINEQHQNVKNSMKAINEVVKWENAIENNHKNTEKKNNGMHKIHDDAKETRYDNTNNYSKELMSEMIEMKTMLSEFGDRNKVVNNHKSNIEKLL